jgi:hypothetical protein
MSEMSRSVSLANINPPSPPSGSRLSGSSAATSTQPSVSPSISDAQHDVKAYTVYFALLSPGIAHSIYFGGPRLNVTSKMGVDDVPRCPVLGTYLYQVAVLARTLFDGRLYSLSRGLLAVNVLPRLLGQGAYDTSTSSVSEAHDPRDLQLFHVYAADLTARS